MKAQLEWISGMHFKGECRGIKIDLDSSKEHGGENLGPSPKELVLHGISGCSGMDVISILKKMRQEVRKFNVGIEVDKNKAYPVHFTAVRLSYQIEGSAEPEKVHQAVELSLSKYCGVSYMISKVAHISYQIWINGEHKYAGVAQFIDPDDV